MFPVLKPVKDLLIIREQPGILHIIQPFPHLADIAELSLPRIFDSFPGTQLRDDIQGVMDLTDIRAEICPVHTDQPFIL